MCWMCDSTSLGEKQNPQPPQIKHLQSVFGSYPFQKPLSSLKQDSQTLTHSQQWEAHDVLDSRSQSEWRQGKDRVEENTADVGRLSMTDEQATLVHEEGI